MKNEKPHILCIGNALVDVFAETNRETAEHFGITNPVQHIEIGTIHKLLSLPAKKGEPLRLITHSSGGGAANAARIAGCLGAKVRFIGAIGKEENPLKDIPLDAGATSNPRDSMSAPEGAKKFATSRARLPGKPGSLQFGAKPQTASVVNDTRSNDKNLTGRFPLDAREFPLDAREFPLDAGEFPLGAGDIPLDARDFPLGAREFPLGARDFPLDAREFPLDAGRVPKSFRGDQNLSLTCPNSLRAFPNSFWTASCSLGIFPQSFWAFPDSHWGFPNLRWVSPKSFCVFPNSFCVFPKSFCAYPELLLRGENPLAAGKPAASMVFDTPPHDKNLTRRVPLAEAARNFAKAVDSLGEDVDKLAEIVDNPDEDIAALKKIAKDLAKIINALDEILDGPDEAVDSLDEAVDNLAEDVDNFAKAVDNLDEIVDDPDEIVDDLDEKVDDLDEKVDDLEEKVDDLEEKVDDLEEKVDDLEEKVDDFQEIVDDPDEVVDDFDEVFDKFYEAAENPAGDTDKFFPGNGKNSSENDQNPPETEKKSSVNDRNLSGNDQNPLEIEKNSPVNEKKSSDEHENVRGDYFGRVFEGELRAAGVDLALSYNLEATGLCLMLRVEGETRVAASPGAALELSESDIGEEAVRGADIVVFDGFMLGRTGLRRRVFDLAERHGVPVALDIGSPGLAAEYAEEVCGLSRRAALILFMNEEEAYAFFDRLEKGGEGSAWFAEARFAADNKVGVFAEQSRSIEDAAKAAENKVGARGKLGRVAALARFLSGGGLLPEAPGENTGGEGARAFLPRPGFPVIVVKLGPAGALCFADGKMLAAGTREVVPEDTTGAGDAFYGAFLAGWVRNKGLAECAALGNLAAGIVLGVPGTKVHAKDFREIAALLD